MAYFMKTLKTIEIYSKFQLLERQKAFSVEISLQKSPAYTLSDKVYKLYVDYICCGHIKARWRQVTWDKILKMHLMTPGTYRNFILKSILGFVSGVLLTYLLFMFLLLTTLDVNTVTWLCVLLAPVLSLGLAFSSNTRCVTVLLLPQFFSQQGRQILLAYAFLLAATGPAQNTFHNMNILSDSLSCTQDQLATASKNIQELISIPFKALSDSMKQVMNSLKQVVEKVKDILVTFKRLILAIMSTIKTGFDWLASSINVCNKKLGTPYERCMRVLEKANDDCKVQVYEPLQWMCSVSYAGVPVCFTVKWIDYLCDFVDWVISGENIFGVIRKKMREFGRHLKTLFYVSISVKHSYAFETNQSRPYKDIAGGIVGEIRTRSAHLINLADWASFTSVFAVFTLYMFYQVLYYRFRFLHSKMFDNRFITQDLEDIDWRRTLHNRETILPLSLRERTKYVSILSARMVERERLMFVRSAVFLSVSSLKLIIYLLLDYSLYWVLSIVRAHGRVRTNPRGASLLNLNIDEEGIVADILKSIISSFKFVGAVMDIDTLPCLPDPVQPDVARYKQILALIGVTWIIAIFQPFGLRVRHYVMCLYHPDVAKQRSIWLYNHILRKRFSFVKSMRRELRRKFFRSSNTLGGKTEFNISIKQRLLSWIPWLSYLMSDDVRKACLVCGTFQRSGVVLHACPTPGCIGTYCDECYSDLHNICTICKNPLEYDDLSDVSEEKDSSEDEAINKRPKKKEGRKYFLHKRNKLLNKLKFKSKKKTSLKDEELELVLPLYREHFSANSSDEDTKISNNLKPCTVDLTPGDIFDQNLPLIKIDWIGGRTKESRQNLKRQAQPSTTTNSFEQLTSDDLIMKKYVSLNMEQVSPNNIDGHDIDKVIQLESGTTSSRFSIESEYFT